MTPESCTEKKKPLVWDILCRIRDRISDLDGRVLDAYTIAQQRTFEVVLSHAPQGILLKDLARIRGVTAGTVSVAVSTLERAGLVRRERMADDRRATLIFPTKKALLRVDVIDAKTAAVLEEALRGVPAEEREVCFRVLEKIRANLENGI